MALIVKCKCGKQMKIPTALGGKKLSCPGCKKSFSIPPEKFKAGVPKSPVVTKGLAVPSPVAAPAPARAAPRPAPPPEPVGVGFEATPSELDLLAGFTDVPSGIIGDNSSLLAPVCPSCSVSLAPDAKICVKCGYDLRTGKHIAGESPTGLPVQDVSYGRPRTPPQRDAIQGPVGGYAADAVKAFLYPFLSGGSAVTFVIILLTAMIGEGLPMVSLYGRAGSLIIFGWIASVYLSIIQQTATGSPDLPGIRMEDGFLEDIVKPAFKYVGAYACALVPAVLYLLAAYFGVIPETFRSGWSFILWLGLGIFLLPMFLMFFAFDALAMSFRIDLMITTIFRTLPAYFCLWFLLLIVNFEVVLGASAAIFESMGLNITVPELPDLGRAGAFIYRAVGVYVSIVTMRQIGLYYLHFKKRFTLVFE